MTVLPLAVCVIMIVVTGYATGGAVGAAPPKPELDTSGLGPRPAPFVAVAVAVPTVACVSVTVAGTAVSGTNVMLLGTFVQMPGF